MAREKLGDILIRAGLLDEIGLQRALNEQARWGGQLGRYLVELGLISEEILVRALSTQYKIPAVSLDPHRMDIGVGRLIPREICERNGLIAFRAEPQKKFVDVAMSDPSNPDSIDEVRVATRYNVHPYIAAPTVIDKAISYVFYGDVAIGGEMDLSPTSQLRLDSRGSELLHRDPGEAQSGVAGDAPGDSSHGTSTSLSAVEAPAPELDVQVSVGDGGDAPRAAEPPASVDLPSPPTGENFHITLDVPAVDKEDIAKKDLSERLSRIEATLTRKRGLLREILESLDRKGIFTKDELRKITSGGGGGGGSGG